MEETPPLNHINSIRNIFLVDAAAELPLPSSMRYFSASTMNTSSSKPGDGTETLW